MGEVKRWVCAECGSARIMRTAWVDVNGGRELDVDPPQDSAWCGNCDEECGVTPAPTSSEAKGFGPDEYSGGQA